MDMTKVTWLHISDFHFRADGDRFSQQQAVRALLASIRGERHRHAPLNFAVVTGDVAFSGQAVEYREAQGFFAELVEATDIGPTEFYFVPGNHDVDRRCQELAYFGGRSHIDSPQTVDYYLGEPGRIAPLMERQGAFWSFVEEFTAGQERHQTPDGLGYVAKVGVDRVTICLLGLNSAWLSGADSEEMRLVIGERQVINAVEAAEALDPHFVVALAHHPVAWLTEWDSASCRMRLLPAVDFYLRGHLHSHEVMLTSSPGEPCVEIAAGSGHATRFYENSYNFASIDLRTGICSIQHYRYFPASGRFEPGEPVSAPVAFRGSVLGTRTDLTAAIRSEIREAAPFAGFMAGLLTNQLTEIPIAVEGSVSFVAPSAADQFVSQDSLGPMVDFLGLRNLLRLYAREIPVKTRIAEFAEPIRAYAASLVSLVSIDRSCAGRLQDDPGTSIAGDFEGAEGRWSWRLLDDMRRSGDWSELESRARTLATSADQATRRKALAAVAEALMHSDEGQKRDEAFSIASDLASSVDASDEEIVLAAATAEIRQDYLEATRISVAALEAGRNSPGLIEYGRNLSTRVGDRRLRVLVERASATAARGSQ